MYIRRLILFVIIMQSMIHVIEGKRQGRHLRGAGGPSPPKEKEKRKKERKRREKKKKKRKKDGNYE